MENVDHCLCVNVSELLVIIRWMTGNTECPCIQRVCIKLRSSGYYVPVERIARQQVTIQKELLVNNLFNVCIHK